MDEPGLLVVLLGVFVAYRFLQGIEEAWRGYRRTAE